MNKQNSTDKYILFRQLEACVSKCDLCKRLCDKKKVLSQLNGSLNSKVLFIAEAPGRLGADHTGIPLYGDKTGDNFEMLLNNIGWKREDIFITNAVLCNPQDGDGNNATPTKEEISNCSYFLEMTYELLQPEVVVTLGAKALEALKLLKTHNYSLNQVVASELTWNDIILFPLYHPSPRALLHRTTVQQRSDFIKLSHIVHPQNGLRQKSKTNSSSTSATSCGQVELLDMVVQIIDRLNQISMFKLTKLLYLIDFRHLKKYGQTISGSIYLRMQEGPWIPYLRDLLKRYDNILFKTTFIRKTPIVCVKDIEFRSNLSREQIAFIDQQCKEHMNCTDALMKTIVYLTAPMKYIIRQENLGRNMMKIPVLYKNSTVVEMDKQSLIEHEDE